MRHIPEFVILLTELKHLKAHSFDVENSPSATFIFNSICKETINCSDPTDSLSLNKVGGKSRVKTEGNKNLKW